MYGERDVGVYERVPKYVCIICVLYVQQFMACEVESVPLCWLVAKGAEE